jgi:competence protein ComEC
MKIIPLLLCLFLLASYRTSLGVNPTFPPDHLVHHASGQPVLLEGVLCQQPTVYATFTRLALQARRVRSSEGVVEVRGRADLWVSERALDLQIGDILLVEARLKIPRPFGNPGEKDRKAVSFLEGVDVRGSVRDARHFYRLGVAEGYRLERTVQAVRARLSTFLDREADPNVRGLLRVWFLGDRSGLSDPLLKAFRSSGLAHLLAISGLHVGLVGLLAYGVIKFLLKRSVWILLRFSVEKISVLASLPLVLGYVLLVGSPVTAIRATAMFVLFVGSLLLNRVPTVWNSLSLAGLLILVWDPAALFSASFLLSFVAVAGLLAAVSRWKPLPGEDPAQGPWARDVLWTGAKRSAWKLLTASLVATIATAPLVAFFFNRMTPLAVLVNPVVVPVVGWLVIPVGLITAVTSLVSATAATPLLGIASAGARFVAMAAETSAKIPYASLWVGRPTVLEMAVMYLSLFAILWLRGSPWRKRVLLVCAMTFCISLCHGILRDRLARDLVITFLSVGQGDSILVEFPEGKRMIVDGGMARKGYQGAGRNIVLPFLGHRRIRHLDYMVASHGQADHYGGLYAIGEELKPNELWISPELGCEAEGYVSLLDLCRQQRIRIQRLCRDVETLSIGGVKVEVLSPSCEPTRNAQSWADCPKRINERSLVLRLSFGRVGVLLTGDIEEKAEEGLRMDGEDLHAVLLKVPHHGSPSSSSGAFLDAVVPRVAVVSAGYGNRFGFPPEKIVRRYGDRGIVLYRTDLHGAVRVRTDGRSLWIETFGLPGRPVVSPTGLFAPGIGGPP